MNKENTRVLGIGEAIRDGDLYEIDGELLPVDDTAVGELISGDELCDIRRVINHSPLEEYCRINGITPEEAMDALRGCQFGSLGATFEEWEGLPPAPEKAKTNDEGKPPLARLPWKALREVSLVQQYGFQKYGCWDNWRKGMEVSRNLSCSMRHVADYLDGADMDSESGKSHLAHAACRILFTIENLIDGTAIDDRK